YAGRETTSAVNPGQPTLRAKDWQENPHWPGRTLSNKALFGSPIVRVATRPGRNPCHVHPHRHAVDFRPCCLSRRRISVDAVMPWRTTEKRITKPTTAHNRSESGR